MHIICALRVFFFLPEYPGRRRIIVTSSEAVAENVIKMSLMSVTLHRVCPGNILNCAVYRTHKNYFRLISKVKKKNKLYAWKIHRLQFVKTVCNLSNGTAINIIRSSGKVKKKKPSFDYIFFRIKTFLRNKKKHTPSTTNRRKK